MDKIKMDGKLPMKEEAPSIDINWKEITEHAPN